MLKTEDIVETYRWAINPVRTFGELLTLVQDCVGTLNANNDNAVRNENILNLYFMFCACQQIISDYIHSSGLKRVVYFLRRFMGQSVPNRSESNRIIRLIAPIITRFIIPLMEKMHNVLLRNLYHIHNDILDVCNKLAGLIYLQRIEEKEPDTVDLDSFLTQNITSLRRVKYPRALRDSFLKIPTVFKDEPFGPEDCFSLSRRASGDLTNNVNLGNVLIVGIRTSGCYMAPLCMTAMRNNGLKDISIITYRPGHGLLSQERNAIENTIKNNNGMVMVVDDAPYSGSVIEKVCDDLIKLGVPTASLRIMVPKFEEAPYWKKQHKKNDELSALKGEHVQKNTTLIKTITIERSSLSVGQYLNTDWIRRQLKETGCFTNELMITDVTKDIFYRGKNERFRSKGLSYRPKRPFPRYKRIFKINWKDEENNDQTKHILAISVGQGFWGYPIKILYEHLADFVPHLYALNDGVALMEWCEQSESVSIGKAVKKEILDEMASYILKRAALPMLTSLETIYRMELNGNGLCTLNKMFGGGLGLYGFLYERVLRSTKKFSKILGNGGRCTIDGKIGPQEWIVCRDSGSSSFFKIDYDEHAYDWRDLRIFDPLYDLASVIFEYCLDEESERILTEKFKDNNSGAIDNIDKKILFYKVLYAFLFKNALSTSLSGGYSTGALPPSTKRERIMQEKLNAKCDSFLTNTINSYLALPVKSIPISKEPIAVFSIDVDNVIELERLGFSATSKSSVEAFSMLKKAGFLPILNSGRSLKEIKSRCAAFGIPYGIAEHGSVIWDSYKKETITLPSKQQVQKKTRLLKELRKDKNIIIDDGFYCSLRVFNRRGWFSYPVNEVLLEEYFSSLGIVDLRLIQTPGKTDIAYKGIDKGTALQTLLNRIGRGALPIYAIGDSISDASMLQIADTGYVPSNCSQELRRKLAGRENIIITPYPYQLGFLWAVKDALKKHSINMKNHHIVVDEISNMFSQHEKIHKLSPYIHALKEMANALRMFLKMGLNPE